MKSEPKQFSKARRIEALLIILGSGVSLAFALALFMLYYYNPSGSYLAKNVLLAPDSALAIRYGESNQRTGRITHFVYDGAEFSYYDLLEKKWKRLLIDSKKYAEFYQRVGEDLSLSEVSDEIRGSFNALYPSTLSINIHAENDSSKSSKVFSQAVFAEGSDYYRVQLRDDGSSEGWAYFYHPGIYQQVFKIFVPQ
jgi:hypothetical protein